MSCNSLLGCVLLAGALAPASGSDSAAGLGRLLFFDRRLSLDGTVSCATCHQPENAFADPRSRSTGVYGRPGTRNAPTVLNKNRARRLFWDGRATSLEQQARGPLFHPAEMGNTEETLVRRLGAIAGYKPLFASAFGDEQVTVERIVSAIAAFERTLTPRASAFDRYTQGDMAALTASQNAGRELFFGKANCSQCHNGLDFTSEDFANIGAGKEQPPDEGRRSVTWNARDWRLFKVPSLRDVSRTAPYMHDGSLKTLAEVIDFYDRGGEVVENKDYRVRALRLTSDEKNQLIDFLKALDSAPLQFTPPGRFPE